MDYRVVKRQDIEDTLAMFQSMSYPSVDVQKADFIRKKLEKMLEVEKPTLRAVK